jgi:WD40 repeat protein/class 3 adenylate cyclase
MTEVTPTLLHGRYEVLAVIGRGGEGTLVRAVDRRHGRDVALKLRRVPSDPRDAERLLLESRTLLSLHPHPGLPLARDDFFEDDRHALVMDWVEGVDLAAVLTEHGQPGLPPSTVLRWLAPVAEALTHLHTTDPPVVHGDVKPANLVLTPTGRVVLVDFGVSSTRGLRTRGGTPGYRAPEVAAGAVPTRAADVYGLAATAFALLTGLPPSGILPTWDHVDHERAARLEQALRRGLATHPVQRTATPGELVEELRAGWDSEPLPTGVVTFLATDVVASTRLWQEVPDAAPGLLAEHLLVVDRTVERHGGRRIGDVLQGDATMSVFHRAGDAVHAGVDLQRALAGGRVQVHCGVHTGEAVALDDSFAGATLSRVARVRALAEAGQVILSATTARLARADLPSDVGLIELGPHRLDGFDQPETIFAVDAPGLAVPPDPSQPPYRGLVPYDVDDDEAFFGREREIYACLQRITESSLLAVVGPSGCGKSSLVRAGVASRLRRAGRSVAVFTPGRDPNAALVAALETAGPTTVLVVDQLEELFAPDVAAGAAHQFLDDLVERLEIGPVVVALRADHVGSVTAHPNFARRLETGLHLVTPMTEPELREVIERPAREAGLRLEPGLVELLLRDVSGEPGGLPLLSFALAETWSNRDGRVLTVDGYLATGGLRQAIAASAERLYGGLPPGQRPLAKALFMRLVTPAPDGEAVRQRIDPSSVMTDGDHRDVVDAFVRTRLVVAGDDGLEVAHEALVREWPRLRSWLEEDREGLRLLGHLRTSAHEWDRRGRDPAELQRGARLAATLDWVDAADLALDDVERRYLDASRAAEEAELEAARDRARRDARSKRRLRGLLGAAAVLLVAALVAGLLAIRQRDRADSAAGDAEVEARRANAAADDAIRERNRADSAARDAEAEASRADAAAEDAQREAQRADAEATLAEARRLRAEALAVPDYDQALLLAVESRHLEDSREAQSSLLATIQRSPGAVHVIRSETEAFLDLGFTPDGKTLIASGFGGPPTLSKYDVTTHERDASIASKNRVSSAVSPDGRLAVMSDLTTNPAGDKFRLHLVDTATFTVVGDPLQALPSEWPTRLSFSPDGKYIAAVTDQYLSGAGLSSPIALVWDVAEGGKPVVQYPFSAENFQRDVAFLPDSKRILVAGADGTAIVDIASGAKVGQIDGAHPPIAISPDGKTLAAATDVRRGDVIGLFDPTSGERGTVLAGHRERLLRLAFNPNGTQLASGADDGLVIVWDVATDRGRAVYEGHAAAVNDVVFDPDGKTLWSGGDDGAIFGWDLQRTHTLVHRASPAVADGPTVPFTSVDMVIGPGGRYVVYPWADDPRHFQIRDVATGALGPRHEDSEFKSFSPDGKRYVTVNDVGRLRVWDTKSGAVLADSEGSGQLFSWWPAGSKAVITPDGRHVVALTVGKRAFVRGPAGYVPETLVVLDATTLAPVGDSVPLGYVGRMISVMPDGGRAVVVANTPNEGVTKVLLVDLETRRIIRSTPVEALDRRGNGPRNNAVAPDGRTVGIGGTAGDVVVVDAVTGDVGPVLPAHDGFVESVTFAPDEASFITTGQDGAVKLWDAATWRVLESIVPFGENHRVRASFLAPDRVMMADDTGEILEWDPRPDAWERHACRVAGRNLTQSEWADFFPGKPYRKTCPQYPARR